MFRATPEYTELLKITPEEDKSIVLTLSKYDSIPTPEGTKIKVKDLKEDSKIIFKEDGIDTVYTVSHIEFVEGKATITFRKKE